MPDADIEWLQKTLKLVTDLYYEAAERELSDVSSVLSTSEDVIIRELKWKGADA